MTSTIQIPVTLRPGRARTAALFLVSLLFVLGGIWMVRDGESAGYFCAGFFALCLLIFVLQFHPKAAYLHLAPDGFTFCSLFRAHTVPWTHVCEFGPLSLGGNPGVGWNYTPPHRPSRRARLIAKFCCGYEAALPDTYGMKAHDLAILLEYLRRKYTETSNAS